MATGKKREIRRYVRLKDLLIFLLASAGVIWLSSAALRLLWRGCWSG